MSSPTKTKRVSFANKTTAADEKVIEVDKKVSHIEVDEKVSHIGDRIVSQGSMASPMKTQRVGVEKKP